MPAMSKSAILDSLNLLENMGYIVCEDGQYKLTKFGYEAVRGSDDLIDAIEEIREIEIEVTNPTTASKILNTISIFLFLVSFILPIAGRELLNIYLADIINAPYRTHIILAILGIIITFSIAAYFDPRSAIMSGIFGLILIYVVSQSIPLVNLGLFSVKPSYQIGFYLLVLASLMWLVIPFTAKKSAKKIKL
jgi:hypothetical protein